MKKLDATQMENVSGGSHIWHDLITLTNEAGDPHYVWAWARCWNRPSSQKSWTGPWGHASILSVKQENGALGAFLFMNLLLFVDCTGSEIGVTAFIL